LPTNDDNDFFYYSIQIKELRNESNLIESFELPRILNSLKLLDYLIQTHSLEYIWMKEYFKVKYCIEEIQILLSKFSCLDD
jgi:hypothetical protein